MFQFVSSSTRAQVDIVVIFLCRVIQLFLSDYAGLCWLPFVLHCFPLHGLHCSQYRACVIGIRFAHVRGEVCWISTRLVAILSSLNTVL